MGYKEKVKHFYVIRIGNDVFPAGVEGMKQHLIEVRKTYPDLKMTIIRQYIDGDTVISEFVMEGTHLGEWLGMKPTGKKLRMTGVDIDRHGWEDCRVWWSSKYIRSSFWRRDY